MRTGHVGLVALLLVVVACSPPAATTSPSTPQSTPTEAAATPPGNGRFDALTFTLTLHAVEVASGAEVGSDFAVRNDSDVTVTDPGCWIGAHRWAISKTRDPLFQEMYAATVDCGGATVMEDGYADESDGPTFRAVRPDGTRLPPGEYIAVMTFRGLTNPLVQPVTVTER